MTSRDRVIRTLNHQAVDRAPRDLWLLDGVRTDRADELAEITVRFPSDIIQVDCHGSHAKRSKGATPRAGRHTDAWGCTWEIDARGTPGALVESPLADPAKIGAFEPPAELLDGSRFARASKVCEGTNRFVLAWSEARPLDRLLFLRGPEAALAELQGGGKELHSLVAKTHDFFLQEMRLWADTEVDGVAFRDDLVSPNGLRIAPKVWRRLFKPLYRQYCDVLHARDKFVFLRTQGRIDDLLGDLIEVGIDAVHTQMSPLDVERVAEKHRGQITFWGHLDRQQIEPPFTPAEIRETVRQVRKALDFGHGGVIAQCPWPPGAPLRNLISFFEEWMLPLSVKV
jgi:uroporphyrinogen decarboxylase